MAPVASPPSGRMEGGREGEREKERGGRGRGEVLTQVSTGENQP